MKVKDGEYLFDIVGRRGNVDVEEVLDKLEKNSDNFVVDDVEHSSCDIKNGHGEIQNIQFKFRYCSASKYGGIPSIQLTTTKWSDDRDIRKIVWSYDWKGN